MSLSMKIKCAVAAAAAICLCGCGADDVQPLSRSLFAMDTYVTFTVYGDADTADAAFDSAEQLIKKYESLWSVNIPDSDIAKLNKFGQCEVSGDTAELIGFTLQMSKNTDGSLDPTLFPLQREWGFTSSSYSIPSDERVAQLLENIGWQNVEIEEKNVRLREGTMLDLGAVAKGFAADKIAEKIKECGAESGIVDLGGNILTFGQKPDGGKWKISVRDPDGGSLGVIQTDEISVVTSGSYERYFERDGVRYHHILDPATGKPADGGIESVTVAASQSALCDALSTALFVMGEQGAQDYWRENGGFDMIILTCDGRLILTEGIAESFEPSNDARPTEVIER